MRFRDLQRVAAMRGEIALGYRRPAQPERGLALNPDRETEWSVEPGDEAVVLTTIDEPVN